MLKNLKNSSGKLSMILLVAAAGLAVLIVGVYFVLKANVLKTTPVSKPQTTTTTTQPVVPKPVYTTTIGQIQFNFESAQDLGNTVKSNVSYEPDLTTTEKFIEVTVGAQNTGKVDTAQDAWSLGNIVDSDGRNFIPDQDAYAFLPNPNLCGSILEPDFQPTPCVEFYNVSKSSTGLKVQVVYTDPSTSKTKQATLDLLVK